MSPATLIPSYFIPKSQILSTFTTASHLCPVSPNYLPSLFPPSPGLGSPPLDPQIRRQPRSWPHSHLPVISSPLFWPDSFQVWSPDLTIPWELARNASSLTPDQIQRDSVAPSIPTPQSPNIAPRGLNVTDQGGDITYQPFYPGLHQQILNLQTHGANHWVLSH
jgi:hypothetical protein